MEFVMAYRPFQKTTGLRHFHHMTGLLLLAMAFVPHFAMAKAPAANPGAQNAMLYIESIAMPKRAAACASLGEGYRTSFARLLPLWIKRHKTEIASGEALMREDAKKNGIPFEPTLEAVTDNDALLLQRASEALRRENCDDHLESLRDS